MTGGDPERRQIWLPQGFPVNTTGSMFIIVFLIVLQYRYYLWVVQYSTGLCSTVQQVHNGYTGTMYTSTGLKCIYARREITVQLYWFLVYRY